MLSSKTMALPGVTFAGSSYTLEERTFQSLPRDHPKRLRHNEVVRFRREPLFGEQPRWNTSVLDEDHRFPERPIMHSLAVAESVKFNPETFPEIGNSKACYKLQEHSGAWGSSSKKTTHSRLKLPDPSRAAEKKPKLNYLATVIARDFTEEKALQRRGWCSSTLATCVTNPFRHWKETVNYVELNKTKAGVINEGNYVSPQKRVSRMNEHIREVKKQERDRAEAQRLWSETHSSPAVFKMSNIDEWWLLDPTFEFIRADASPNVQENSDDEKFRTTIVYKYTFYFQTPVMQSTVDPIEFQKIVGNLMKKKYLHEQRVADSNLSQNRQRCGRSRSSSRTSEKRCSLSNSIPSSRVAPRQRHWQCGNSGASLDTAQSGLPRRLSSRDGQTLSAVDQHSQHSQDLAPQASDLRGSLRSCAASSAPRAPDTRRDRSGDGGGGSARGRCPSARRWSPLRSPALSHGRGGDADLVAPQSVDCQRCIALEGQVTHMQQTLDALTREMRLLTARQIASEGQKDNIASEIASSINDGTDSDELPDNPDELGGTLEEKFLTVVTILAKRMRRIETDLTASLDQVRIMEAAAIERDVDIKSKVGRVEVDDILSQALQNGRLDIPNELAGLYRLWGLDPRRVRAALSSPDSLAATELLLGTPPFARVLRAVMDTNNEILTALHEQQVRNSGRRGSGANGDAMSPCVHKPPGRLSDVCSVSTKGQAPLHELLLGVCLQDEWNVQGVRVVFVTSGTPIACSVRPGDIITQVNGVTVRSIADVSYVLSRSKPTVPISISVQVPNKPYVEVVEVPPLEVV